MATLTKEQIEQKKQMLAEKTKEAKALYDELVEAGAIELSDDDLDQAAGGIIRVDIPTTFTPPTYPDLPDPLDYPTLL